MHCGFDTGSLKINICQSALLGVGHKKEYPVYAVDNIDQSGRPLKYADFTKFNDSFLDIKKIML